MYWWGNLCNTWYTSKKTRSRQCRDIELFVFVGGQGPVYVNNTLNMREIALTGRTGRPSCEPAQARLLEPHWAQENSLYCREHSLWLYFAPTSHWALNFKLSSERPPSTQATAPILPSPPVWHPLWPHVPAGAWHLHSGVCDAICTRGVGSLRARSVLLSAVFQLWYQSLDQRKCSVLTQGQLKFQVKLTPKGWQERRIAAWVWLIGEAFVHFAWMIFYLLLSSP